MTAPGGQPPKALLIASLIGGAVLLAAVAIFVVGPSGSPPTHAPSSGGATNSAVAADVSRCERPPALTVESVDTGPSGLTITTKIQPNCAHGDLLTNSAFRLTAVDSASHDVASGTFNLGATPIAVTSDGASVAFTFASNSYWRTKDSIVGSLRLTAHVEGIDQTVPENAQSASAITAAGPGAPESGNIQAVAQSALVDIAAADRSAIDASLLDQWQPQLSSKRPGLVADGQTWWAPDIIREHLNLRQRFPNARLVWSGDWPVFGDPSWWVTLAGYPYSTSGQANGWCASQGYDADHCFAKVLSHTRRPTGTTALR
jgi:hypothetical protein